MERQRSKHFYFRTGRCERLEDRNMLAGHPLMMAFSPHVAAHAAPAHFGSAVPGAGNSAASHGTLAATLSDPANSAAIGTVTLQTSGHCGSAATSLTVTVSGEAASTALSISVAG